MAGMVTDIMPKFREERRGRSRAGQGRIFIRNSKALLEIFPVSFLLILDRPELCHKAIFHTRVKLGI